MKRMTPALCAQTAKEFNQTGRCPAPFSMRFCGPDDLAEILAIGQACFSYNPPTRREINHVLTKAHAAIFALCEGEKMAGYLLVEAHAGRQTIYFNTTAILSEYRGQGLGGILYEFTDFLAPRMEAKGIWCHVAVNNLKTIHLLEKNGYAVSRKEEEYYDDGNAAFVMRKVAEPLKRA